MAPKNKTFDITPIEALALAIETYNSRFISVEKVSSKLITKLVKFPTKQRTTNPHCTEKITAGSQFKELMEEAKQLLTSLIDVICLKSPHPILNRVLHRHLMQKS